MQGMTGKLGASQGDSGDTKQMLQEVIKCQMSVIKMALENQYWRG